MTDEETAAAWIDKITRLSEESEVVPAWSTYVRSALIHLRQHWEQPWAADYFARLRVLADDLNSRPDPWRIELPEALTPIED